MKCCSVLGSPRASVGLAFQAEHSPIPSSTYQPFDEYICHLWHHYSCTRTPSLSTTTTPSGASERKHCQCLSSPLRPLGRAGVFRRREGPASQSLPGTPPSFFSSLPAGYVRGVSMSGGFAALLQASMRGGYVFQGVRMCFPGAIDTEFGHRNSYVLLTESLIHGNPVNRGVRTSVPGRDRVPVRPLCFRGPHSYVALARPDQRPRARVVRDRLVQRHCLRSGSVGLTTGFGLI